MKNVNVNVNAGEARIRALSLDFIVVSGWKSAKSFLGWPGDGGLNGAGGRGGSSVRSGTCADSPLCVRRAAPNGAWKECFWAGLL